MRHFSIQLLLALCGISGVSMSGATSVSVTTTSTQAVLRIKTDQTGACSFKLSPVNDFSGAYAPAHDVDPSLFSGSDQCSRAGNIDGSVYKTLVLGKRAAELALDGKTRYSRALQALTRHYYQIAIGANIIAGSFVTTNALTGNTRNDTRFDRNRPGEYAFPSMDWTSKTTKYIDPFTGIGIRRATGPGDLVPRAPTGLAFTSITGTAPYYLLTAVPTAPVNRIAQSLDSLQLVATISGSAASVNVCLTKDGVKCSGATINQAITTTPAVYTIGTTTPILAAWRNAPVYPVSMNDLLTHTLGFLVSPVGGTIALAAPSWNNTTSATVGMGSYGAPQMCSPVKVMGPTGPGQVCSSTSMLDVYTSGNVLLWFGDDGTTNAIGLDFTATGGTGLTGVACGGGQEGVVWDRTVAGKFWCLGTLAGAPVVYSATYSGTYAAHVTGLDETNPNSVSAVESGNLNTMVSTFTASDTPNFAAFTCASGWQLIGRQTDDLLLKCFQSYQDSAAWFAVYRTTSKSIVGAITTFGGGPGAANRWGGSHSVGLVDGSTWTYGTVNQISSGNYESTITSGTLLATGLAACPTNTIEPAQAGVVNCNTVTLGSLTPLAGGVSLFGQAFIPGDYGLVTSGGAADVELVRILAIGGLNVTVLRSQKTYQLGTQLAHSGALGLRAYPSTIKEMWWNYGDDPHGITIAKPYGVTVFEDATSANCHQIFAFNVFRPGCTKPADYLGGFYLRVGALPGNFTAPLYKENWDAWFNGSTYQIPINFNETHPSMTQSTATAREQQQWFDARPYLGDPNIATAGNISTVGTYTWKLAAAATASMQYRKQGFLVLTGMVPLVDVSPAIIADTTADAYKYCVVVITGDCKAASVVGEVYFNVPFLTTAYVQSLRFVPYPANAVRDISITQNTHTVGTLNQGGTTHHDFYGRNVRRLTTGFAPMKIQTVYWNYRALPDASRFYWGTTQLEGVRDEILVGELPPFPNEESTYRGEFIPITLSLGGTAGDAVRVRFGYTENGPATSLFCHERQVACSTDASGVQPYLWTDEPQQWTPCDSGCKVKMPVISGRVAYYAIDRRNADATVSTTIEAIAVP